MPRRSRRSTGERAGDRLIAQVSRLGREFYFEADPEISAYLSYPLLADAPDAALRQLVPRGGRWQSFLTTAGMVAVVDSVLASVLAALVVQLVTDRMFVGIGVGVVAAVGSGLVHVRHQVRVGRLPAARLHDVEERHQD
ncbi:MAG TPA: hypothetical protein VI076_04260 [Actinopolymorphaceae bacterium]